MAVKKLAAAQAPQRRSRSKAHAAERLQSAQERLAAVLPLSEVDEVVAATEQAVDAADERSGPRVSPLTGEPLPSTSEMARIRRENLLRAFADRRALLADALSVDDVATLLGVGRQTPHDRVRAGTLLAVKENGRLVFPLWQFDAEANDGILAGLPAVLRALDAAPISAVGRVRWFQTPKALLGGRTPLDALRSGNLDDVLAEAESIGLS